MFELVLESIKPNAGIPPVLIILNPIMKATRASNIPPMPARVNKICFSITTGFFDCVIENWLFGRPIFSDRYCDCC